MTMDANVFGQQIVCLRLMAIKKIKINNNNIKAIAMMRRKSPPFEKIYFIENHCQTNTFKGRRGKDFNKFFIKEIKLYFVYMSL